MKPSIFLYTLVSVVSAVTFTATSLLAEPDSLTDGDRKAITEKLDAIQKRSENRIGGLHRNAIKEYREAVKSDNTAMKFYYKCYEKVHYIDMGRKTSEFLIWKRNNKERFTDKSIRMAMRYQLSWLILSIEASHKDGDATALSKRAMTHLNHVLENASALKDHQHMLKADVFGTVFAKAYGLNIKVENWPKSALNVANIYNQIILPPYRTKKKYKELRAAWQQRINMEKHVIEKWGAQSSRKTVDTDHAVEIFDTETTPTLLWNMEKDCFEAGDERQAAKNMLRHIEKHFLHSNTLSWIKELKQIITPHKKSGN